MHDAPKAYLADIALGFETATDDREGQTTEAATVPPLTDAAVTSTLASFLGPIDQIPPAYSAVHVRGERAYARARRGERLTLGPRRVEIFALDLIARDPDGLRLLVTCSAGTYVRALARDVGRALGTRAHLRTLRRVASGPFAVEDAFPPHELRRRALAGDLAAQVHAVDELDPTPSGVEVAARAARRLLLAPPSPHSISPGESG